MSLYRQFRQISTNRSPYYQNSFFLNFNFFLSAQGFMMSSNMCKLRHKLKYAKHLPKLTSSWQNKPWCSQSLICFCRDTLSLAKDVNDRYLSLWLNVIEKDSQFCVTFSVNNIFCLFLFVNIILSQRYISADIIFSQRDISVNISFSQGDISVNTFFCKRDVSINIYKFLSSQCV